MLSCNGSNSKNYPYEGLPKLGIPLWGGVPIIRIIIDWGLSWGPPIQANYQNDLEVGL